MLQKCLTTTSLRECGNKGEVTQIYTYGLSFGNVDLPYIRKICDSIPNTQNVVWYLNRYDLNKIPDYQNKIISQGFKGKFDGF